MAILTAGMTPTHRTLQASAAAWDAIADSLESAARGQLRPTSGGPVSAIRQALSDTDDAMVRVTLTRDDATRVMQMDG